MFSKILIANRGEIACRVIRTAHRLGISTVAVYSDADIDTPHVDQADEAIAIGPPPAAQSYLLADKIIAACKETGAQAVHPGYGFLSENAGFAEACKDNGLVFIGPPSEAISAMGDKITSKQIAKDAGVATVPGYAGIIETTDEAVKIAAEIGYPVMIKASAGGGGKGMRIAHDEAEVREGFDRARSEAKSSFGDDRVFIEKFVTEPRHIEIQVLADGHGNCIYLGERECSIQRRNQKVIEEAPSPFLDEETRRAMGEQACALARAVGYQSAGTVEFIVDRDRNFYFLEMNTRLQVEHPVTELITGVDLVEQMLRVANGEVLDLTQDQVKLNGWAMEGRVYAEDPYRNFLPSPGRLTRYRPPEAVDEPELKVRNDTGVAEGGEVTGFYDPMISKLCTWAPDRDGAIAAMAEALDSFELEGIGHNVPFLQAVMHQPRFREGQLTTSYIADEFPDGFSGAELDEDRVTLLLALAAILRQTEETRRHASAVPPATWCILDDGARVDIGIEAERDGSWDVSGPSIELHGCVVDWRPGDTLARIESASHGSATVKVTPTIAGYRLRHRGADVTLRVVPSRVADLAIHMPVPEEVDHSRHLLSPMPGQVVRLDVNAGDQVEAGQALAIVEAMKMENVLRAERRAIVARINCEVGAAVAADEIIMEFEVEG